MKVATKHKLQCELHDECQEAKDGWRCAETRIKWQETLTGTDWRDEPGVIYFKHIPIDYWDDCLLWINDT